MFISNAEKAQIFVSLEMMQLQIRNLETELVLLRDRVAKLEVVPKNSSRQKTYGWTPEQRKAASDRMKKRHAEKKAQREST
tara:strand:+ start:373 stop:615 length:243 start_codon:yes stop_codon:yes gene_type:complete